jgi:hypothetical protein
LAKYRLSRLFVQTGKPDYHDGQQTANTLQWTRRHLIRAPQWWHEMTNRFAVSHEITAAAAA